MLVLLYKQTYLKTVHFDKTTGYECFYIFVRIDPLKVQKKKIQIIFPKNNLIFGIQKTAPSDAVITKRFALNLVKP